MICNTKRLSKVNILKSLLYQWYCFLLRFCATLCCKIFTNFSNYHSSYKLTSSNTEINNVKRTAPIKLIILIIFIQFFADTFEITMAIKTPIIHPNEFVIRSVISLAPIAKINCTVSKNRLVQIIGANCISNDLSSHKI